MNYWGRTFQKEPQVQRLKGSKGLSVFEELKEGHCDCRVTNDGRMTGKEGGDGHQVKRGLWAIEDWAGFYSNCGRKPFKGFRQESDVI